MRILLIEDDASIAQSIKLTLKFERFNVHSTDLGKQGVRLGTLYDYDIILLDLNLPDMSGYEVLRSLRISRVKTPILILSGLVGMCDKVRGLGFGADDYLTKPFHRDELVARIPLCAAPRDTHTQSSGLATSASTSTPRWSKSVALACTSLARSTRYWSF
jgi:two-component system cell cycle response regulator CtrA